jgi:hypothetical protein
MRSRSALPLALTVALVACLGEPIDAGDTDGFRVTNLNPANGATGVPLHDWCITRQASRLSTICVAEIASRPSV